MAATVLLLPRWQFFANDGSPLSGGSLETYAAGSSTPLATYSDRGLSVTNGTTITLNSAGRPSVNGNEVALYGNVSYKFICKDSGGTTVWTQDYVYAPLPSILPTTYAIGDLLYADSTSTLARLADVATGQVLASGGVGTAPACTATPTLTALTCPSVTAAPLNLTEGRLTLTSGTPVTTGDVSAATSIYYTPYVGNRIALYNGTRWNVRTFPELTLSVADATASKPYDVFVYDNNGTPALEKLVWTDATTRATALTTQDGVYVKTGAVTRRYLGSFYCNVSGGQTDDTFEKRSLWNYYHRVERELRRVDTTDSWTYSTATYRQANGSAANQVEVMVGVAEVGMNLSLWTRVANSNAGVSLSIGIGEDSTSAPLTSGFVGGQTPSAVANAPFWMTFQVRRYPAVGRHVYTWLEKSEATPTTTWYGDDGSTATQSGLQGSLDG